MLSYCVQGLAQGCNRNVLEALGLLLLGALAQGQKYSLGKAPLLGPLRPWEQR